MCSKEVEVTFAEGLHARPASNFIKLVGKFKSKVTIEKNGKTANAKSMVSILTLGVRTGDKLILHVEGEDQEAAMVALEDFFAGN